MAEPGLAPGSGPPAGRAGFLLLEVLVAVVIAGLALGAIGRALAGGWASTRTPLDVLSAVALARADASRLAREPAASLPAGFTLSRRIEPAVLVDRPADIAPAPLITALPVPGGGGPVANDVMPGVTVDPRAGASGQLQWVTLAVRTPTGRVVTLQTLHLDAVPN